MGAIAFLWTGQWRFKGALLRRTLLQINPIAALRLLKKISNSSPFYCQSAPGSYSS